jgi:hypothetical protein
VTKRTWRRIGIEPDTGIWRTTLIIVLYRIYDDIYHNHFEVVDKEKCIPGGRYCKMGPVLYAEVFSEWRGRRDSIRSQDAGEGGRNSENAPPFLHVSYSHSGARAPSDVPRLQRYLHLYRVSTHDSYRVDALVLYYFAETEFVR